MRKLLRIGAIAALASVAVTGAEAATLDRTAFGTTEDGRPVDLYTMTNDRGMRVRFLSYGGVIASIEAPDRTGRLDDVVLGFRTLREYETKSATIYFGAIIGRYANRIANGRFTLDGQQYQLAINNRPNSLHGGAKGFDKQVWNVRAAADGDGVAAVLTYTSQDGDGQFPRHAADARDLHALQRQPFRIDYRRHRQGRRWSTSRTTPISTWRAMARVRSRASRCSSTPIATRTGDASLIPTGELAPVAGTPLDFRQMTPIGARLRSGFQQMVFAHGYDHNFVLNKSRRTRSPLPRAPMTRAAGG